MNYFKKFFIFFITTLVVLSIFIFPALATATSNSVTWDSDFIWLNTYRVRGYVKITEYSGLVPTAYITATANNGDYLYAEVTGVGYELSNIIEADLSIPFLTYTDTGIEYRDQ